jgi:DNA-binding NtrC family response regulator
MTGAANPDLEARAGEVAEGYLAKPFDMLDLMLMVQQVVSPGERPPTGASPAGEGPFRVLLVEDDHGLRTIYGRALEKAECYQVDAAATLDEARQLLDAGRYDILISDVRIGRERATELLEEYRTQLSGWDTRVVLCSAFGQYQDLPQAVDRFVVKPIPLDDLVGLVGDLVESRKVPKTKAGRGPDES